MPREFGPPDGTSIRPELPSRHRKSRCHAKPCVLWHVRYRRPRGSSVTRMTRITLKLLTPPRPRWHAHPGEASSCSLTRRIRQSPARGRWRGASEVAPATRFGPYRQGPHSRHVVRRPFVRGSEEVGKREELLASLTVHPRGLCGTLLREKEKSPPNGVSLSDVHG
jgi:hypothetical protein